MLSQRLEGKKHLTRNKSKRKKQKKGQREGESIGTADEKRRLVMQ